MKKIKAFFCKIGWHFGEYEKIDNYNFNGRYRCKNCGYEGLVDSNGDLF